jgi:hypothetical protein
VLPEERKDQPCMTVSGLLMAGRDKTAGWHGRFERCMTKALITERAGALRSQLGEMLLWQVGRSRYSTILGCD